MEFRDGYCEHGKYVGGCGIDYMCGWCEQGISLADYETFKREKRTSVVRKQAQSAEIALNILLVHGMGGIQATEFLQHVR